MMLQLLLRRILLENQVTDAIDIDLETAVTVTEESIKAAVIFVTIGPIVLVYPFAQRYFIKGIMIGSIKG